MLVHVCRAALIFFKQDKQFMADMLEVTVNVDIFMNCLLFMCARDALGVFFVNSDNFTKYCAKHNIPWRPFSIIIAVSVSILYQFFRSTKNL